MKISRVLTAALVIAALGYLVLMQEPVPHFMP